tara:strand:- start:1563 stop:1796 length:234 start_codon:yes stop_codon:yes gene_type:complete
MENSDQNFTTAINLDQYGFSVIAYYQEDHWQIQCGSHQNFKDFEAAEVFEEKVQRWQPTLKQLQGSDIWSVLSVTQI